MITFKQQITVPNELVLGLALELGWKESFTYTNNEGVEVTEQNPQTAEQFVDERSKQHTMNFFIPFGIKLVEQEIKKLGFDEQKEQARAQIMQQIIKPVTDALTTEVLKEE
jgi:hypothetical protein